MAVVAWLRLVWKLIPQADGIGEFTADLIRETASSATDLLDIFPPFMLWVRSPGISGRRDQFSDVIELWLKLLWKQPVSEWYRESTGESVLTSAVTTTLEFFHEKKSGEIDRDIINSCLQFLWAHCDEMDEEVQEATVKMFRTDGESTMEDYRALILPAQIDPDLLIEFESVYEEFNQNNHENQDRYEELCERLGRNSKKHVLKVLNEVWQKSLSTSVQGGGPSTIGMVAY